MDKPFRVLPQVTDSNRHFWTGGERDELVFLACEDCRQLVHPPSPRCPECLSRDLRPRAVSGRGHVASYTVNHQPWNPTMPERYVVALVEIDEQPSVRLMTNIVGCDPDDVRIGMPVQVVFEQDDDVFLPFFTPLSTPVDTAPAETGQLS